MKSFNEKIQIGFIGLGARGMMLLKDDVLPREEIEVTALCDLYADKMEKASGEIVKSGRVAPKKYADYMDLLNDDNVNTVIIATGWEYHVEIACEAMKKGKAIGMEVGGASSVEECRKLVRTYEEHKVPFMFLENCCFGRRELMALNMARQGLFGEIVHAEGGYCHDLRKELAFSKENRHYRLEHYLKRNCENYPTHDLGPIAKLLDIGHGNKMLTLTSTASKAGGLKEYIKKEKSDDYELLNSEIRQGDIITTVIKCERGETIVLSLDTTLPRFYSRRFTVRGTKGMYDEATDSVFLDIKEDISREWGWLKHSCGNAKEYEEKYDHEIWKEFLISGIKGGHGGMDWLEFDAFFDCLKNNKPMPIDVYDAASWMVITALSEESIAKGGKVMEIPDFTSGKWISE